MVIKDKGEVGEGMLGSEGDGKDGEREVSGGDWVEGGKCKMG